MIRLTLLSSVVFVMTQPMAAAAFMMAPSSSSIMTRRIPQISPLLSSSSSSPQTSTSTSTSTTKLSMSKGPPPKNEKPENEFSRPIRTDIILSPRSRRAYNQQISATETELSELATRFSLSKITNLEADLALSQDVSGSGSGSDGRRSRSDSSGIGGVIVKGDVKASVTQTCVRTNEDFEVELEFSIFSIVKPTELRESQQQQEQQGEADMTLGGLSLSQIEDQLNSNSGGGGGGGGGGGNRRKGKNKKRGGNKSNGINKGNILNEMKMKEIESLLQDFDTEDDIFEDENVLASDGILDIGELVAQMFRLKLDPYPKKPGSEPVSYSISG